MQITITVPDEIIREAQSRGLPLSELVETLIRKGLAAEQTRASVASAIERIRALRSGDRVCTE